MMSLILASGNVHKAQEFKELFKGKILVEAAPSTIDVEEIGDTYIENAYLKAKSYYDFFKRPALADDSGLIIDALPEILGVKSARFAPHLKTYAEKCQYLLELLLNVPDDKRLAHFSCVLCFYLSRDEVYFFEGRLPGLIGNALKGGQGFGYDPIFIPNRDDKDGRSLAELPEWKNEFSHRAKASQGALQFFKEIMDKTDK